MKIKMIEFLKKIKMIELIKYGMVTAGSYIILYAGSYFMVEKLGISPRIAYFTLLTLIYVGVYVSYTLFVFKERFTKETFSRFIIALIVIWAVNNTFFYILTKMFNVHYLIVITLNILLFGGLRFLLQRFYVFKSSYESTHEE